MRSLFGQLNTFGGQQQGPFNNAQGIPAFGAAAPAQTPAQAPSQFGAPSEFGSSHSAPSSTGASFGSQSTTFGGQSTTFGGQGTTFGSQGTPFGGQGTLFGGQGTTTFGSQNNSSTFGSSPTSEEDSYEKVAFENTLPDETGMKEQNVTVVNETPLATSYTVDDAVTITSDGIAHQVTVAVLAFEANLTYIAVPRVEAQMYLQV